MQRNDIIGNVYIPGRGCFGQKFATVFEDRQKCHWQSRLFNVQFITEGGMAHNKKILPNTSANW